MTLANSVKYYPVNESIDVPSDDTGLLAWPDNKILFQHLDDGSNLFRQFRAVKNFEVDKLGIKIQIYAK